MSYIELKNISKIYGNEKKNEAKVIALNNISFSVNEGEFIVILGASGAGKSTLLNILGGMDLPTSGQYIIGDHDIAKYNDKKLGQFRREEVGFVFQFYNLMPNLTALENIALASSVVSHGFDPYKIIKDVGLEGREGNFPAQLSGGQQQRIAIARAIVKNPKLLLCDEPTGALDSKTGALILKLLQNIAKDYNKTVIIVTHNSKIASIAKRVVTIQDGKILKDEINENPINVEDIVW